jgi:hypothetical protein
LTPFTLTPLPIAPFAQRDFLVTIMELTGEEGAQELYAEEQAVEKARREAAEAARRAAIPGLLNPYAAGAAGGEDDDAF